MSRGLWAQLIKVLSLTALSSIKSIRKKSFQQLPEDRHQFIKRACQGIHKRVIDGEDLVDELQEEMTEQSEDLCAFDTLARVSLLWI